VYRADAAGCTLIYARSHDWGPEQTVAYRILNASQHSLSMLTYDHVLERALRMLSMDPPSDGGPEDDSGIPF
jgi:hypothetical protein